MTWESKFSETDRSYIEQFGDRYATYRYAGEVKEYYDYNLWVTATELDKEVGLCRNPLLFDSFYDAWSYATNSQFFPQKTDPFARP